MTNNNNDKPRILLWDIEIYPNLKEIFNEITHMWPGKTMRANLSTIICFGYKWLGEDEVHCLNLWDYPEGRKDKYNDTPLLKDAYEVLEQADTIITHYGERFDRKWVQTKILKALKKGLPDYTAIDTCQVARKHLFLSSNRLKSLASYFDLENKLDTGGWELWSKVHWEGDRKSRKKMTEYCKQDVLVLEQVYYKLLPYIKNHPNLNLYIDPTHREEGCRNCGSENITYRGYRLTATGKYRRFICKDCGTWGRDRTAIKTAGRR